MTAESAETLSHRAMDARTMEKLILTPKELEIVVGSGCTDGAVDLFSYGVELEPAARNLGSLYIVGWRQADTNTMGYMVSLIAALARREYYANVADDPNEAFSRTLRKINEVVEEFFKSEGTQLAVGVFAIAGGRIMVSKLDKFKILLAREGEVIDILNNIALFSKEHVQKRQFSSIISGSIMPGDRLLAYYPAKIVVARERAFREWLLKDSGPALAVRLAELGESHPGFAASFVHVDMVQAPLPVEVAAAPRPPPSVEPEPEESLPPPPSVAPQLAWSPRQVASVERTPLSASPVVEPEQEIPNIIPTEFSLGTRRSALRERFGRLRIVRLDGRGKAAMLVVIATVIVGASLIAKTLWFTSAAEQHLDEVVSAAERDIETARSASNPVTARSLLASAILSLQSAEGASDSNRAQDLTAKAIALMDEIDGAHTADLSVVAQLDPRSDKVLLVTYASESQTFWALASDTEGTLSAVTIADGAIARRESISGMTPNHILGWKEGVIVIDFKSRMLLRIGDGPEEPYIIPTDQEIIDAAVFGDSLYLLTDSSILRVSDLTTTRTVTRPWLVDGVSLPAGASRLVVDGSIHVFSAGTVTTFYRGELEGAIDTPLNQDGSWSLVAAGSGRLAAAVPERLRIYTFSLEDGTLTGTLKIESQQPLVDMDAGPDGTFLVVTQDNRIWKAQ